MRNLHSFFSLLFVSLGLALGCGKGFDSCEDTRTCAPSEDRDGTASDDDGGLGGSGGEGTPAPAEGSPCDENHATGCLGADQMITLLCEDGTWQVNVACSAGQNCDQQTGLCTDLVDDCALLKPADEFCDGEKIRTLCGPDRVSSEEIEECPGLCVEEAGSTSCLDECGSDHGNCDPLVTCTTTGNGPACGECPSGYSGDGETGCAPLLTGLTVSGGTLSPQFDSAVTTYSIKIPLIRQTIRLVPSVPPGAQVTIDGDAVSPDEEWVSPPLNLGENELELVVIQPDRPSTTYLLSVTRGEQQVYVKASNTELEDGFGYSVALSGDGNTMAVGAYGEDSATEGVGGDQTNDDNEDSGAVYVFSRTGSVWAQQAYLKASNTGPSDFFGRSLSLSSDGNTLAVGAYQENSAATGVGGDQASNAASDSGAVYIFSRAGSTWAQQAYVKASNTGSGDAFGYSVSLAGDGNTLAVGAHQERSASTGVGGNQASDTATNSGAVYIFSRTGSAWTQQAYVKASNTGTGDLFGSSVSLSDNGNTLAVGAYQERSEATGVGGDQTSDGAFLSGAVYVFSRTGIVWAQQAYVKASNTEETDAFGYSVSLSGDGDTLAVGASVEDSAARGVGGNQSNNAEVDSGAVYVFSRAGSVWSQQAYVKASNTEEYDRFGVSVSLSSDGNTLAVGAYQEDGAATSVGGDQASNTAGASGAAYVFSRTGSVWSQQEYVKALNTGDDDAFGISVCLSGDASTLAVGAHRESSAAVGVDSTQASNAAPGSGAVYVYR